MTQINKETLTPETAEHVEKVASRTANAVLLMCIPGPLLVAIEFVGVYLTDNQLRPLFPNNFLLHFIGNVGLALSFFALPIAIAALLTFVSNERTMKTRPWLLLIIASAILLSLFGCTWTFSGHPTWGQGYAGLQVPKT